MPIDLDDPIALMLVAAAALERSGAAGPGSLRAT
jgi:hypothetical protein